MRRRDGFTLIEILLALAILGGSFTVLLMAHAAALRQEARARRLMTATLLARELLTRTEVEGVPELGADRGDFGEAFPAYTWERQVENTEFEGVRLVRLVVRWPEGKGTASTEVVYYYFEKGEEP